MSILDLSRKHLSLAVVLALVGTSAGCALTSPVSDPAPTPVKSLTPTPAAAPVTPPPPTPLELLTDRIGRVEQQVQGQGLVDLLMKIEALQTELQQLRGEAEVQANTLEQLSQRQRDGYLDADRRLTLLERQGETAARVAPDANANAATTVAPNPVASPGSEPPGVAPTMNTDSAPAASAATTPAVDPAQEQQAYQQAFNELKERRYPTAIKGFQDYLAAYPSGRLADNAKYWLAEAYYVSRDLAKAGAQFAQLAADSKSARRADALLKLGNLHADQQQWAQARERLNQLQTEYPGTAAATSAKAKLQELDKAGR